MAEEQDKITKRFIYFILCNLVEDISVLNLELSAFPVWFLKQSDKFIQGFLKTFTMNLIEKLGDKSDDVLCFSFYHNHFNLTTDKKKKGERNFGFSPKKVNELSEMDYSIGSKNTMETLFYKKGKKEEGMTLMSVENEQLFDTLLDQKNILLNKTQKCSLHITSCTKNAMKSTAKLLTNLYNYLDNPSNLTVKNRQDCEDTLKIFQSSTNNNLKDRIKKFCSIKQVNEISNLGSCVVDPINNDYHKDGRRTTKTPTTSARGIYSTFETMKPSKYTLTKRPAIETVYFRGFVPNDRTLKNKRDQQATEDSQPTKKKKKLSSPKKPDNTFGEAAVDSTDFDNMANKDDDEKNQEKNNTKESSTTDYDTTAAAFMVLDELSQQLKKSAEQQLMLLEDDSLSAAANITPHDDNTTTTTTIIVNIMDELLQQTIKNSATTTNTTLIAKTVQLAVEDLTKQLESLEDDDARLLLKKKNDEPPPLPSQPIINNSEKISSSEINAAVREQNVHSTVVVEESNNNNFVPSSSAVEENAPSALATTIISYKVERVPLEVFSDLISSFDMNVMQADELYAVVSSLFKKGASVHEAYVAPGGTCYQENYLSAYRGIEYSSLQLSMLDFLSLRKDQWVESFVIDIYFSMLNFRELSLSEEYLGRKKVYYYSSALYNELSRTSASKNLLGKRLLNYTKLYIPINLNNHWILCEIQLDDNSILITSYDSKTMCSVDQSSILTILGKWIKNELNILNKYNDISPVLEIGKSIQQEKVNNVDCGIIVMFNVLILSSADGYYSKILKYSKTKLNNIITNSRYIFAMDIERGYIVDCRLTSYYKLKCYPFQIKKLNKIKNVNKEIAELCAFVEGSKEKPINLLTDGDGFQQQQSSIITINQEEEKNLINKWKFSSYKAQISLLSFVFPHFAVLPEFFKIESIALEQTLLQTLHKMEVDKDNDLKVVAQHCDEFRNDNKRFFYNTSCPKRFNKLPEIAKKIISELEKSITSVTSNLLPDLKQVDISILYSKSGCGKQKTHTDYDLITTAESMGFAQKSFFGLFAIMDNTTIIVYDEHQSQDREVDIPKGCFFFGRGDLVHAGNSYTKDNVRLHFYFDHVYANNIDQNDRGTYFDFDENQIEE
jgi:hypothetical protein